MNKLKFIAFTILFVFQVQTLFSQNKFCATRFKPAYYTYAQNRTQIILSQIPQDSVSSLPQIDRTLSVAIHIVKDSLGETNVMIPDIYFQIENTNNLFKPIALQFNICSIDSIDNFQYDTLDINDFSLGTITSNEEDQMVNLFNVDSVINVYLVSNIHNYSWASGLADKNYMIVVKENLYEIPHMMGHIFGLLHTNGNGTQTEFADSSNCEIAGDFICETSADPCPDPYVSVNIFFMGCELSYINQQFYLKDPNDQWYIVPSENYMSFFSDCRCKLTPFQYRIIAYEYFLHHKWLK